MPRLEEKIDVLRDDYRGGMGIIAFVLEVLIRGVHVTSAVSIILGFYGYAWLGVFGFALAAVSVMFDSIRLSWNDLSADRGFYDC